jgi:cyclic beta-1,2-glucan synthetase
MLLNTHVRSSIAEPSNSPTAVGDQADFQELRAQGAQLALQLPWVPRIKSSDVFSDRCRRLKKKLMPMMAAASASAARAPLTEDTRWLRDNESLIYSDIAAIASDLKLHRRLPHVHVFEGENIPRILAVVMGFLKATGYHFSEQAFSSFCLGFQEVSPLELREFKAVVSTLKLALLKEISERGRRVLNGPASDSCGIGVCVQSLREVGQISWKEILEPLILFDQALRKDPVGCYAEMDFESRDLYRRKLAAIAAQSDLTEIQVADEALALAREAHDRRYRDPRISQRESHIGYYLIGEGREVLSARAGCKPNLLQRLRSWLRRYPDEFFLPGIALLTCTFITGYLLFVTPRDSSLGLILVSMLLLLLPSSQGAVQVIDYIITTLLPPDILPKLDFSKGVSADCMTLVAIPTLLMNEKQVRALVEDLEVRFLGNHDPNIYFAIVSDLPDAYHRDREDSPLIDLCASLVGELNEKYAGQERGSFLMFHRHRVYNPRERGWMGWERKRGKLLDLNKLLRGEYDSFPVKVGDLSILPKVRFVITLDTDTELPRGSAQRMIGAMAHPLNQAIIDPVRNIVVAGYGILQPRVGVSVQSTARSRLAAVYAGETGFDIYTRAVSDAYQDLYGEGSFTGKGIYEVETVHRVLDRRFPRNALLSHDLIEGAYARAGLASDIELIEDYPSHYSAYNRRKHRWLRGDWQIAGWLLSTVPDESGARVPNPISLISRWKILDNLRRSLVEPATFVLLLFGWLVPGGQHLAWTLGAVFLLALPICFQLAFGLGQALYEKKSEMARQAASAFLAASVTTLLTLAFLVHQTLLSLDAVARAIFRRFVSRERLLEWETAAEAEAASRVTPVDRYLNWTPIFAIGIGLLVWFAQPSALPSALPIVLLWASSKLVSGWLNRSPLPAKGQLAPKDLRFLRRSALHTWRYFAEFCTEEHNWLIPDNVQETPPAIAARVSPTNLGLLLNAQQVACELGYLIVPEMAAQTERTLSTLSRIPKERGHLLNWYDTRTLEPLAPHFVSSVDSGNLVASLWTLEQGCRARLQEPLLQRCLAEGVFDILCTLADMRAFPRKQLSRYEREFKSGDWLPSVFALSETAADEIRSVSKSSPAEEIQWFRSQALARLEAVQSLVRSYVPWELPEFAPLREGAALRVKPTADRSLEQLPHIIDDLHHQLDLALPASQEEKSLCESLRRLLPQARTNALQLAQTLRSIAAEAAKLANAMDFSFLLNPRRKLMSVGFNAQTQELEPACYDLLATESRTAVFAAIGKDDVPQECWFRMGRGHTMEQGRPVLLSWTGTMFEYLMPTLWMRSYSNTLLDRSRVAVVDCQREYGARKGVPWGISESAYFKLDEAGNYQYRAFGLPQLALMKQESNPVIISPYSTFLALTVDSSEALRNLHRMDNLGWFGPYGFYESADFSAFTRFRRLRCRLVKCWMAHHQGMSLLAMANLLCDNVVQRWFHSSRRVQATELLLHEKPVSHVSASRLPRGNAA